MQTTRRISSYAFYGLLCGIISLTALLYLSVGHAASNGAVLIMPLDDAYIHFQYARMIATGQPFHYNPGDPATSGATSLLYPFLLAVGYGIGFHAEQLALWAVFIGWLAWIGSACVLFRLITRDEPTAYPIGVLVTLAFALSGAVSWAFMSGMETGLLIFATLLTLWCMTQNRLRATIAAAVLVALIRPEGAVISVGALLYCLYHARRLKYRRFALITWFALPLLAIATQPLINLVVTGSIAASGMQAKSYLYNVPFDGRVLISAIFSTAFRIWHEFLSGIDPDGIVFSTGALLIGALVGALTLLRDKSQRSIISVIALWLIGLTGIISLLETAFWQFKRYQQPMIALLFVLMGWVLVRLSSSQVRSRLMRYSMTLIAAALLIFSIGTLIAFVGYYGDNIHEVASLQISMARYVATHTPIDARIGVHDIGVMRYLGDRATYDVVGLTTPDAARAWRNGPGAVYETMLHSPYRPDYLAIYTDPHGLSYFQATDLYASVLARFSSTNPPHNVASASAEQVVTQIHWDSADRAALPHQIAPVGFEPAPIDSINVADLQDENAHAYQWWNAAPRNGYATELYQMGYLNCDVATDPACRLIDGGRLITGGEDMIISTRPGQDLLWVTRVHPHDEATIAITVDGQPAATRVIPGGLGGHWLDIVTLIPAKFITHNATHLRTQIKTDGAYMPYYHWFFQGHFQPDMHQTLPGPSAHFGAPNAGVTLLGRQISIDTATHRLRIDVEWLADPAMPTDVSLGDDKIFVHVYDSAHTDQPPITQSDQRPRGSVPPADWLSGVFRDTYYVPLPDAPGTYQVAIGLYDATSTTRLMVTGNDATADGRLFIDTIATDF